MNILENEGIDEVQQELLKMVHGLPPSWVMPVYSPEERVAGLRPEERVADLTDEQKLLLLPPHLLKLLPRESLDSLSPETRATIAERLAKP